MMKTFMGCVLIYAVLISGCKAGKVERQDTKQTKQDKIEKRTIELEKEIEKKIGEKTEKGTTGKNDTKQPGPARSDWGDAPDFTLERTDGGNLTLSSYIGNVVILDFWATWCGPCRMGIPEFVRLYKEYKDKGLVMIGINLDRGGREAVLDFIRETGMNYPVVYGTSQVTVDYGGIRGIPAAFIIDRKGNIVNSLVGYRPGGVFETEIKKLL